MSMTSDQAETALKARLAAPASGITAAMYWRGDIVPPLPDVPAQFLYFIFDNEGSGRRGPTAYGGGQGRNLYRNRAVLMGFAFAPRGNGALISAQQLAEQVASRLRSYRETDLCVYNADVLPAGAGSAVAPPGLHSPVNNYQCAIAEISASFDQIG